MDLDATVSGVAANSYIDLYEAGDLMEAFEQIDAWDELDQEEQERLLYRGTRLLDAYKSWGLRAIAGQALAFPRKRDGGLVPRDVKLALMECVDFELEGSGSGLKRQQAEGVTSVSVLGKSMTFAADSSRLPAGARVLLDELYLSGQEPIVLNRRERRHPRRCKDESLFG